MTHRLISLLFLIIFSGQLFAQPVDEIVIDLTVLESDGRFVSGLEAKDVIVKFGNKVQTISSIQVIDQPVSVGILFDMSGSQENTKGRKTKLVEYIDAIKSFVENGNPENDYFVVSFSEAINLLLDSTQSNERIIRTLDSLTTLPTSGNTRYYDAIDFSAKKLTSSRHKHRVIIVVTDGEDNVSEVSQEKVKRLLENSKVFFYPVLERGFRMTPQALVFSDDLAFASGGRPVYVDKSESIKKVISDVATELRSQYRITFVPNIQASGKRVEVDVSLAAKPVSKLRLRYRKRMIF